MLDDGIFTGYVLAGSPSTIAGITPAEPAAVQRRAVAEADATAAQVSYGMAPLPLPLAVSGVRAGRSVRLAVVGGASLQNED